MSNVKSLRRVFENSDDVIISMNNQILLGCNKAGQRLFRDGACSENKIFSLAQVSPMHQPDGQRSDELESQLKGLAFKHGYTRHDWTIVDHNDTAHTMDLTILHPETGKSGLHYMIMRELKASGDCRERLKEQQTTIRKLTEEINSSRKAIELQKEMIETQRDVAIKQRDEINLRKTEITSSITYAKYIQSALLPTEEIFKLCFKDYFIFYKPKDIVSGDFYWIANKGNLTILAAADCTGHGVPGGFMSIMGIAFLNEIVDNMGITTPARILDFMRERVIHALSQGGRKAEAQDGMDIALISYDPVHSMLQYAGANNQVFLIRDGQMHELEADRMPIGSHYNMEKGFTDKKMSVRPKDSVYLFSDGYRDQYGWRNGTKFKLKNFKQLLLDIQHVPMTAQKVLLENNLSNWQGDLEQVDDIMVIGVQL